MRRAGIGSSCRRAVTVAVILAGAVWSCGANRDRPTTPVFGDLVVISDPEGAQIAVDGTILESTTPATLEGIEAGTRTLELALVPGPAEFFGWQDTVTVSEERLDTVEAALEGGCNRNCPFLMDQGRIVCRSNGRGDSCASVFYDGVAALQWPGSASGTTYGAGGRLLLAGIFDSSAGDQAGDTIATQVYDVAWIGRQPMARSSSGGRQVMEIEYWGSARYRSESLQGLSVKETLIAVDSAGVEDVLFIHFEIENVSDDERYRRIYPWIPEGGYTYESLYIGFGLDADVGSAENDLGTFDPDLDLSFMYDAFFRDEVLGDYAERPALVGLVTVEPPAGTTRRTFTLWRREDDWDDGDRHDLGWRVLAGRLAAGDPIQDHPSPDIGYQGTEPNDYRLTEAHGPLRLAPGESTTFTVAIVVAEPVPGTYTPGTRVPPGDPTDPNRQILAVANSLRALAAQVPALWTRYRP
jgi:PEGA domain